LHEFAFKDRVNKLRKRVGRGHGSGCGKTSGRGQKGQNSRSGGGVHIGFEGGQMPLHRRIPKRGFTSPFKKRIALVNVSRLNCFDDGEVVGVRDLIKNRLVSKKFDVIKVLGNGELSKKITIRVGSFSHVAKKKIEAAGGIAEVV
jgi:large subunit ribosomal protein L15